MTVHLRSFQLVLILAASRSLTSINGLCVLRSIREGSNFKAFLKSRDRRRYHSRLSKMQLHAESSDSNTIPDKSNRNSTSLERRMLTRPGGVAHHLYDVYAGSPNVSEEIVEGKWKWRSRAELAKLGLFRGSYRPLAADVDDDENQEELGRLSKGILSNIETGEFVRDDENFAMRVNELRRFKMKFGHCNVPMLHQNIEEYGKDKNKTYPYKRLANWCHIQRIEYGIYQEDASYSFLTPYRIRVLEEIGFEWNIWQQRWLDRLERLKQFKLKFGHCRVPVSYEDKLLVSWVQVQRDAYKKFVSAKNRDKINPLTIKRIETLNEIGFVWDVFNEAWNNMYARLLGYKERYGNVNVPRGYETDPELATWVSKQRTLYRNGMKENGTRNSDNSLTTLSDERIKLLKKVDFVFEVQKESWENWIEQLIEYKKKHGDCAIPSIYESNQELANWARYQRQEFVLLKAGKKSSLTEVRVDQLSDLGFEWNLVEFKWLRRYEELSNFKKRFGNCMVPATFPENPELSLWCKTQRRQHSLLRKRRRSTMTKERIDLLLKLGFDFDPPAQTLKTSTWDKRLEELIAFKAENGNYDIPQNYSEVPGLFNWLKFQKQEYRRFLRGEKSSMTKERLQSLEAIDFDFFAPEQRPNLLSAMKKDKRLARKT